MSSPTAIRRPTSAATSLRARTPTFEETHPKEDLETRQPSDGRQIGTNAFTTMSSNMNHRKKSLIGSVCQYMNSTRLMVLLVLCLQNSMFTVLRRYSQGVLREVYSKVRKQLVCLLRAVDVVITVAVF